MCRRTVLVLTVQRRLAGRAPVRRSGCFPPALSGVRSVRGTSTVPTAHHLRRRLHARGPALRL